VLAYDSGSCAKLMCLLGVERPELEAEPRTLLTMSGMLKDVGEGDKKECVAEGVGGALPPATLPFAELFVELFLECFIADNLGGDGARVDEECVPLVKRREMEAVAVDVPASATGAGVLGRN